LAESNTTDPHPWYPGGCDALGPFETCAECNKLVEPAYKVEKDDTKACRDCGHGTYWDVIGPGDVALGHSFSDPEEAEWIAAMMSVAYEAGRRAKQLDISSLSWNGFNVAGDRKSIDEVRRLMGVEDRLRWFERHHRECAAPSF